MTHSDSYDPETMTGSTFGHRETREPRDPYPCYWCGRDSGEKPCCIAAMPKGRAVLTMEVRR